jgi:heme exporter protein B
MLTANVAWAIARKDLRLELRTQYTLGSALPFAATMLLAFGFALGPDRLLLVRTAPGLLWLAGMFAAIDLFHRSYQAEAANGALEGLLLSPVDKGAVYLGKAAAAAVQLGALFTATAVTVALLFGLPVGPSPTLLALTTALTVLGRRQAALPILVLPLATPVLIAAIRATTELSTGSTDQVAGWIGLLVAFDAAFLATGYLVFTHLLED